MSKTYGGWQSTQPIVSSYRLQAFVLLFDMQRNRRYDLDQSERVRKTWILEQDTCYKFVVYY